MKKALVVDFNSSKKEDWTTMFAYAPLYPQIQKTYFEYHTVSEVAPPDVYNKPHTKHFEVPLINDLFTFVLTPNNTGVYDIVVVTNLSHISLFKEVGTMGIYQLRKIINHFTKLLSSNGILYLSNFIEYQKKAIKQLYKKVEIKTDHKDNEYIILPKPKELNEISKSILYTSEEERLMNSLEDMAIVDGILTTTTGGIGERTKKSKKKKSKKKKSKKKKSKKKKSKKKKSKKKKSKK